MQMAIPPIYIIVTFYALVAGVDVCILTKKKRRDLDHAALAVLEFAGLISPYENRRFKKETWGTQIPSAAR